MHHKFYMRTAVLFSESEIQAQVREMARHIQNHYGSSELLAIGILKGAFLFYTDLIRHLKARLICDFCAVSFYGDSLKARKEPSLTLDIRTPVKGKDVLLIDCIADRGHSLSFIKRHIEMREPKSLKSAVLVTKPAALEKVKIDFSGFQIEQDVFVVGYGIDYKNEGRHFNHFAQVCHIN